MRIEPIPGERTRWIVYSTTRKNYAFIVDSDWDEPRPGLGRWACGCEQFMVRGVICKHILAVQSLTSAIE
jgi:hypothetical protein